MPIQSDRRLFQAGDVSDRLQLTPDQIDHLVNTGQLRTIQICGQVRFDSRDLNQLIDTYKTTQARAN